MSSKKLLQLLVISFGITSIFVMYWRSAQAPRGAVVLPATGTSAGVPSSDAPASADSAPEQAVTPADTAPIESSANIPANGWGRNPFQTIEEINAANQPPAPLTAETPTRAPVEPGTGLPVYVVSGIFRSRGGNRVIIDARVLQVGDPIGQETVKEIRDETVVLEHQGKTRELKLKSLEEAMGLSKKGEKP